MRENLIVLFYLSLMLVAGFGYPVYVAVRYPSTAKAAQRHES